MGIGIKFNRRIFSEDKFYGSTLVGARGQVVVPAEARKDLKVRPGDRLLVVGKAGRALVLAKAEGLADFLGMIVGSIGNDRQKAEIKRHIERLFGDALKGPGNKKT